MTSGCWPCSTRRPRPATGAGRWPPGTAQGIALHSEYKSRAACLIEIDCRPATVNRQIHDAYTGPRVTKAVFAVDAGLPINPLGLKAQMMGGIMDGIAQALTYSLHLKDGHFLEGSWDNAYYTRQWNTPPRGRGGRAAADDHRTRRSRRAGRRRGDGRHGRAPTAGPPARARRASRSTTTSPSASRRCPRCHRYPSHRPTG